ncbi:MAG: hypothetical protein GXO57_09235 [Thermodesulfobacteria bacterium]|nr:hypothetical protein [Thermodesulfobacteriota bacterium]
MERLKRLFITGFLLMCFFVGFTLPVRAFKPQVLKILSKDERRGKLVFPTGIKVDSKDLVIYVVDSGKDKIILYDFNYVPFFSLSKGRGIVTPISIDIDGRGDLYVLQERSYGKPQRISILDPAGILEREIFLNSTEYKNINPTSLAVYKNDIYLVGTGFPGVLVIDKNTGKVKKYLKISDEVEGFKTYISFSDVYVDTRGRIYLVSEDTGKFYVYDNKFNLIFKAGEKGGKYGQLSRPAGIAASPLLGIIVVMDYMRHTGLVYDYNTGKFLGEFGGEGWSPGWFAGPTDVDIDSQGRIYIVDSFNKRIQIIVLTPGENQGIWSPTFVTPLQPVE